MFFLIEAGAQVSVDSLSSTAAQKEGLEVDSYATADTVSFESPKHQGSAPFLDAEVKYSCKDSLSFDFETKKMYLFGEAEVVYGEISLTAHAIELDMDSTIAYAYGKRDSLGVYTGDGNPVFKDKSGEYEMRQMKYNFETKKAIITHIVTEQGEGFVVGQTAKRVDEKTYFMRDAKYTTCDNHFHPHFYLNLTKAKVVPGKRTVTGPAYLVLLDVPTPIAIPFAIIPNTKSYSSGIIIPTYGDESSRGFYLRNGGYYLAASEFFDVKLLADIYTKGSWGAHVSSTYKKRYKFSGSMSADFIVNVFSEKDLPDYSEKKDFSLRWNHSQDSKANPDQTFSASVNFSTSSFNKNNVNNLVNPQVLATNQKSSSISYSRKWQNFPFRLQVTLRHSQNSRDTTIALTLPDVNLSSTRRFYPFKPKNMIGKGNPFTDVNINYTMSMKNSVSCKEKDLKSSIENYATTWKSGVQHTIPVTTNIKLGRYFSMSPNISYTERWYTSKTVRHWNDTIQKIIKEEPTKGFNRSYNFSFSTGVSTKMYLIYTPIRALFGDKINAIRQVVTPSVSFSYTPDFSKPKFGSYDYFEYYDAKNDSVIPYKYSYFDGYQFGAPGASESASLSFSLSNQIEMKVKSESDTTGFKKIPLLENLSLSTSYNILADKFKWSTISAQARTKVFGTAVTMSATFDPYGVDVSEKGTPVRVDKWAYNINHRVALLQSASLSFGYQLSPETFKKKDKDKSEPEEEEDEDWAMRASESEDMEPGAQMEKNHQGDDTRLSEGDDGYAAFNMPWSLSMNYSLRVSRGKFNKETKMYAHKISQTINVSGNLSLTPNWKVSVSSGYSFDEKKLSQTSIGITRDLHCWSMNFNLVPVGAYKSYSFNIAASSSILRDLKYNQSNSPRDNGRRKY
ncbi:MAG: LPS-assembly protein LptD [Bacteroidales bacterium]|nr:LPS-assembly protein LptD [Bacteroidales bacterium]